MADPLPVAGGSRKPTANLSFPPIPGSTGDPGHAASFPARVFRIPARFPARVFGFPAGGRLRCGRSRCARSLSLHLDGQAGHGPVLCAVTGCLHLMASRMTIGSPADTDCPSAGGRSSRSCPASGWPGRPRFRRRRVLRRGHRGAVPAAGLRPPRRARSARRHDDLDPLAGYLDDHAFPGGGLVGGIGVLRHQFRREIGSRSTGCRRSWARRRKRDRLTTARVEGQHGRHP